MEPEPSSKTQTNLLVERVAFAFIVLSFLALCLIRIGPTDTSWHIATARLAFSSGSFFGNWPTTNTFSYTYPDYPLYQQYPLFQSLLYGAFSLSGWEGVSILHAAMWLLTFFIWIFWSGGSEKAIGNHHLLVLLALGLHQRMLPRPLMLSLPIILMIGLCIENYRNTKNLSSHKRIAAAIVFLQALLTLSHQVFPIGILILFSFLVHLLIVKLANGRFWLSKKDADLPILPLIVALPMGLLSCLLNPLGKDTFLIPWRTSQTLKYLKPYVLEFESIFSHPYPLTLLIIALVFAVRELWRARRNTEPYYLAIFLMGLILGATFWRGIGFAIAFLLFICLKLRAPKQSSGRLGVPKLLALTFTYSACFFILFYRWIAPIQSLNAPQPGIGQSLGQWPGSSIEKLKSSPPPGNLMNASWYTGNAVIFSLYPQVKPFTDPRFEAYPPLFLQESILALGNPDSFEKLRKQHNVSWVLFQMKNGYLRKLGQHLIGTGKWHLVAIDTVLFALVRESEETTEYIKAHSIDPAKVVFEDLLDSPASLREEQLAIVNEWKKLFQTKTMDNKIES